MPKWMGTPRAEKFIKANPSVKTWLAKIPSPNTRNVYGQTLQQICEAIGYSPEKLLDIRTAKGNAYTSLGMRTPRTQRNHDTNGYAVIDKMTDFLANGTLKAKRGRKVQLDTVRVADLAVSRRQYMYSVILSFFKHNRCELPREKLAIEEQSRIREKVYLNLEEARAILGALKEPYRTLCTCALYAGMGVGEMCLLNDLWSRVKTQLDNQADPVRIDISRRKSNKEAYFTFIPSKLLRPYLGKGEQPFKNNMGNLINPTDIELAFRYARKRADISKQVYPHMLRDLFRTASQFKAGMDGSVSNYLMGHSLRREMGYLQPEQEPERVQAEWQKWCTYLDSGVSSEEQMKVRKLEETLMTVSSQLKTEKSMRLKRQLGELPEATKEAFKGTLWVMHEDGTYKAIETNEQLIAERARLQKLIDELS